MSRERGAAPLGVVMGGTLAVLLVVFLVGVLLPSTDAALGASAAGKRRTYSAAAETGRKIYVREGCFTCHTQMVRDTESDRSLGSGVSMPGNYLGEQPNLIGLDRIGPDLICAGDRERDVATVVAHLRKPSSVQDGSTMPSYAYLSDAELHALAAYLIALTCGTGTS